MKLRKIVGITQHRQTPVGDMYFSNYHKRSFLRFDPTSWRKLEWRGKSGNIS